MNSDKQTPNSNRQESFFDTITKEDFLALLEIVPTFISRIEKAKLTLSLKQKVGVEKIYCTNAVVGFSFCYQEDTDDWTLYAECVDEEGEIHHAYMIDARCLHLEDSDGHGWEIF